MFQSQKSLAELANDLLPPPIEFKQQRVGDTDMMVAVDNSKSTFWLDNDSYQKINCFADIADCEFGTTTPAASTLDAPAPLILSGPVKCSKSTMLDVIPGILSHRYRTKLSAAVPDCPPSLPIPLKWDISPISGPSEALDMLLASIEKLAFKLGIDVYEFKWNPKRLDDCLDDMQDMVSDFAGQAAKRNIFIWIYADEIQVLDSNLFTAIVA